jgi:hypothetical protein
MMTMIFIWLQGFEVTGFGVAGLQGFGVAGLHGYSLKVWFRAGTTM